MITISSHAWWGEFRSVLAAPKNKRGALLAKLSELRPDFDDQEKELARRRLLEEIDPFQLTCAVLPLMMTSDEEPAPWKVFPAEEVGQGHDAFVVAGVELFAARKDAGDLLMIVFYRTLTELFLRSDGRAQSERTRADAQPRRFGMARSIAEQLHRVDAFWRLREQAQVLRAETHARSPRRL